MTIAPGGHAGGFGQRIVLETEKGEYDMIDYMTDTDKLHEAKEVVDRFKFFPPPNWTGDNCDGFLATNGPVVILFEKTDKGFQYNEMVSNVHLKWVHMPTIAIRGARWYRRQKNA